MRMHDFCKSLFKGRKSKKQQDAGVDGSSSSSGQQQQATIRAKHHSRTAASRPKSVGDVPGFRSEETKVIIPSGIVGPVFVPAGPFDPWGQQTLEQKRANRKSYAFDPEGPLNPSGRCPPHLGTAGGRLKASVGDVREEDEEPDEGGFGFRRDREERRSANSTGSNSRVCRTASVKSDSSAKSRHSVHSTNSGDATGSGASSGGRATYNGDRAFCLSSSSGGGGGASSTSGDKGMLRKDDQSGSSEEGGCRSISRYIDDDAEEVQDDEDNDDRVDGIQKMGGCALYPALPPLTAVGPSGRHHSHPSSSHHRPITTNNCVNNRTNVKRSCTIAMGDNRRYHGEAVRPPNMARFTHVERDRFLKDKQLLLRGRPVRRDSDRQQHRPSHHQQHQANTRARGPQQHHQQASTSGNTNNNRADRRKTLSSVDANEVKMIALASKALTDHVKDMTEKTRTRCCGVPNNKQQTEKENFINNHVIHHGVLEPHNYIVDHSRETTYVRGKLLGKGGFAKCYEITEIQSGKCYACKIISKTRLSKPHQKEKIAREVELHKNLNHENVVGFHSYFEDNENVYIVLEYCSRKSLVHVLKNRKTVTEPEVRFYLRQLVEGCRYIHSQKIIHRDLKLGNMLLSEGMHVKIADFGLATRVEYDGEKKMTVCGTPNYIAPEVLQKKGHSYEADIWAMGCVMYALLLGRPPFETSTLKETYMRITANKFSVPAHISPQARSLIQTLLTADPARRPTLDQILQHEFLTSGYNPTKLPTSCCDSVPKWPSSNSNLAAQQQQHHHQQQHQQQQQTTITPVVAATTTVTSQHQQTTSHHHQQQQQQQQQQRPKSYAAPVSATEAMQRITSSLAQLTPMHNGKGGGNGRARSPSPVAPSSRAVRNHAATNGASINTVMATRNGHVARPSSTGSSTGSEGSSSSYSGGHHSRPNSAEMKALPIGSSIRLYQLLASCLETMPDDANPSAVHNAVPLWVTKWVDYSNKYGFGFQLSDRSVGVLFNDTTRMMLSSDAELIFYNDLSNKVYSFPAHAPPRQHEKKATLLKYFAQYMDEHLIHGGDLVNGRSANNASSSQAAPTLHGVARAAAAGQGTFMKKWFRTGKAIVMYLNSGTLQVNFFDDHTKVILSPEGQDYLVTYINTHRQSVTYRLLDFRHFGCNGEIQERLHYARRMLESIINIEGEPV